MAKTRAKKTSEVQTLVEKLQRMKSAVFTTTAGLRVKDVNELRLLLRAAGVDYVVAKKTIFRRALETAKLSGIDVSGVNQSFAITFGYEDEVAPAKLLAQYAKTHEVVKFVGGILNGALAEADQMTTLSKLPSRQELRAQVVGTIAAPLSGFVNVLVGNLRGLVRVLDQVRERRASTA